MMARLKNLLILFVAICLSYGTSEAKVATKKSSAPRIRFEWGAVAGVSYPISHFSALDEGVSIKQRLGYSAGIHMGVKFNKYIALQPEIVYTHTALKVAVPNEHFSTRVRSNCLQVPVQFSLRLAMFRFNVGPVITVMDNPTYKDRNHNKALYGRIYPTFSYTAGVGVCLLKHMLIDLRYNGQFNKMSNCISVSQSSEAIDFKSKSGAVQLKIGVLF